MYFIWIFFAFLSLDVCATEPSLAAINDRNEVVQGNNDFAIELYNQLKAQPGNLFISPASIYSALAMTYAGARGDTAAEMARTLHFTLPSERLHTAMGALLHDFDAAHNGYTLKVANALWAQQGYAFLDDFLTLTSKDYGAGLQQVDFRNATEVSRQTVNDWAERQTENKIKDLIQPGVLSRDTRLILTNAIYFKGDWAAQFRKEDTKDEDFYVSAWQKVRVPMMHRKGSFKYFNGGNYQELEFLYKNRELSMIVFLPNDEGSLTTLEQAMTPTNIQKWVGQLKPHDSVLVSMPRINVNSTIFFKNALKTMGMRLAFEPRADFSGMTGDRNLYVDAITQQISSSVEENGTEAEVATAVTMTAPPPVPEAPPHYLVFSVNHPFVFLIRDNRSGIIMFISRVIDPAG